MPACGTCPFRNRWLTGLRQNYDDSQWGFERIAVGDVNGHLPDIFEKGDFDDFAVFAKIVLALQLILSEGRRQAGAEEKVFF